MLTYNVGYLSFTNYNSPNIIQLIIVLHYT